MNYFLAVQDRVIDKHSYLCCEICGKSSGTILDFHHIMTKARYPKHPELNNPINILLVDRRCHDAIHAGKLKLDDIIKERDLINLFKDDSIG